MKIQDRADRSAPPQYETPRVEAVIDDEQIPREVAYAGVTAD